MEMALNYTKGEGLDIGKNFFRKRVVQSQHWWNNHPWKDLKDV